MTKKEFYGDVNDIYDYFLAREGLRTVPVLHQAFQFYLHTMGDAPKAKTLLESLRKSDIDEHLLYTSEQDFNFLQDRVKPYSGRLRKSGTFALNDALIEPPLQKVSLPDKFDLHAAYPNPFNPVTTIKFDLPEASSVMISIYNVLGQNVATLINGKLSAGRHEREWNAARFSSGIYFVRMQAGNFVKTTKVTLLK